MNKFKTLELLIVEVIEMRPPFFKGKVVITTNNDTMSKISTSIDGYAKFTSKYKTNNEVKTSSINGMDVEFKEDVTLPEDVITYKFVNEDE